MLEPPTDELNSDEADLKGRDVGASRLVEEEEKDTGVVKLHVYNAYWKAVGSCLSPLVLLALLLMQGLYCMNQIS